MPMLEAVNRDVGSKEEMSHFLRQMMRIRAFEEKVFELLARDVLKGASHVYAGQEAVAVGSVEAIKLDSGDKITSTHRGHGHCVASGGRLDLMLAELCGKEGGYCRGRGGSMHIADVEKGNLGATGIVGGNLPVATGAALTSKMRGEPNVTICYFGDGAANEGSFHESLNMAGKWKLPVIYICENNLYGMSVSVDRASAVKDHAIRCDAYDMAGVIVDGQDVLQVNATVAEAAERARKGEGPTLVEAKTYRYRGHSRSDPRAYRTKEEEAYWRDRDPIKLFRAKLEEAGVLTETEADEIENGVDEEMAKAEHFALEESEYPKPEAVDEDVYAGWRQGKYGLEPIDG